MESNVEVLFYRAYNHVFVLLQYLQTSNTNIQNKGLTVINNYRFELNTFKLLASISQLKVWWL